MNLLNTATRTIAAPHSLRKPGMDGLAHVYLRTAALLGCLALATLAAYGQASAARDEKQLLGTIQGTVSTAQGDAASGLAGITVQLIAKSPETEGKATTSAVTDDSGHYAF